MSRRAARCDPPGPGRRIDAVSALARLALAALLASGTSCSSGRAPAPTTAPSAAGFAWRDWGPAAFAEAASARKIVLIDVVAVWCHWCHVMDEETYADPEVAALLRDHFVAIRVDSDARPDVAERYADWGWPATAVLTSDARPVLELRGYQDPREFAALLQGLVADQKAGRLTGRRDPPPPPPPKSELVALRAAADARLDAYYDAAQHGWGRKQKYPLAANNEYALLRAYLFKETDWQERALATLERQKALIDPVWGGVYQYSVGGVWTDPHFEKISAIQAGALESYALAYRRTGAAGWRDAAREVRRYILGMLQDPGGGFYTSQDADLRHGTGEPVLGADYYARDDAGRRALGVPAIDRNLYADLNGKLIRALCLAHAAVPGESGPDAEALRAAVRAGERLLAEHLRPEGGFSHAAGERGLLYLRDQAAVGGALLALHSVTGEPRWLERARGVADFSLRALQAEAGGFYAHTEDPAAVGVFAERRLAFEENGRMARFLLELHRALDHAEESLPYAAAAERALRSISAPALLDEQGRMLGEYLVALALLLATPVDITVVGRPEDPAAQALLTAALALDEPRASVAMSPPGARYPGSGQPAVYICTDSACSAPITGAAALRASAESFLRGVPRP